MSLTKLAWMANDARTFEANLTAALEALPKKTVRHKRLLEILQGPDTKRKRRKLRAMEAHAAVELGRDAWAIDWAKVLDWARIIGAILSILMVLL